MRRTCLWLGALVGLVLWPWLSVAGPTGPRPPIPEVPAGWRGMCVSYPIATAQCLVWRTQPGNIGLLLVQHVTGHHELSWQLPGDPQRVLMTLGLEMPHPVRQILPTTMVGPEAWNTMIALQYLTRVQLTLDYLTPPRTVVFSLDGLTEAVRALREATRRLRQTLVLPR